MHRTQRQIERYRKGTALIQVQDQDGRPCLGAQISIEQETHQFQFGCLVSDLSEWSRNDRERYHRRVTEVFNVVRGPAEQPHSGTEELTLDLRESSERMHLAEVQRQLDRFSVPVEPGKQVRPKIHIYASGRTIGSGTHPASYGVRDNEVTAAEHVAGFYTLCFSHPCVRGIFWSGVSDREKRVSHGGLLRRDLSPTHAHKTLRKLIHMIWHTRARGTTDAIGGFSFHGFFGTYRVVVAVRDKIPAVHRLCLEGGRPRTAICIQLTR